MNEYEYSSPNKLIFSAKSEIQYLQRNKQERAPTEEREQQYLDGDQLRCLACWGEKWPNMVPTGQGYCHGGQGGQGGHGRLDRVARVTLSGYLGWSGWFWWSAFWYFFILYFPKKNHDFRFWASFSLFFLFLHFKWDIRSYFCISYFFYTSIWSANGAFNLRCLGCAQCHAPLSFTSWLRKRRRSNQ